MKGWSKRPRETTRKVSTAEGFLQLGSSAQNLTRKPPLRSPKTVGGHAAAGRVAHSHPRPPTRDYNCTLAGPWRGLMESIVGSSRRPPWNSAHAAQVPQLPHTERRSRWGRRPVGCSKVSADRLGALRLRNVRVDVGLARTPEVGDEHEDFSTPAEERTEPSHARERMGGVGDNKRRRDNKISSLDETSARTIGRAERPANRAPLPARTAPCNATTTRTAQNDSARRQLGHRAVATLVARDGLVVARRVTQHVEHARA